MSSLEKKKTKASIKDRFPLEKLTVSQLVKKLNVFYGTWSVHKRPILSQLNIVHNLTQYFC